MRRPHMNSSSACFTVHSNRPSAPFTGNGLTGLTFRNTHDIAFGYIPQHAAGSSAVVITRQSTNSATANALPAGGMFGFFDDMISRGPR